MQRVLGGGPFQRAVIPLISVPCFLFEELLGVLDRFNSPFRVAEDDLVLERLVECLL